MRKLKKFLALALVAAMTVTTMATAAFTDSADIKATEAVNTLNALGIIKGNPDGSFAPEKVVTRAEMAKMIFTLRNGGNDNASYYNNMANPFTDMGVAEWAKGYVNYCYSLGIIAGKGNGKFDPNGAVTGLEAAKMLLVTMGYDATKAGLVGSSWALKTAALASESGLFDDYSADIATGAPRQYAAQIIFNAISAKTVRLEDGTYTTLTVAGTDMATVGKKYMSLNEAKGILTSSGKYGLGVAGSKETINLASVTPAGAPATYTSIEENYSSLLGQEVKVLYKATDNVYGVSVTTKNTVKATTWNKVEADGAKVKFDGTSYDLDTLQVILDGAAQGVKNSAYFTKTNKADKVVFVDNDDDDKFELAIIETVGLVKVTYVGKDNFTVSNVAGTRTPVGANQKMEDVNLYTGVKKDDYAVITKDFFNDKDNFVKATMESGKITGTKTGEWLINGTWYKAAVGVTVNQVSGDTIDFIAIGGLLFYTNKTDGASGSKDLAVVLKAEAAASGFNTDPQARLMFTDDTKKVVNVTADYTPLVGKLVTYSVNNDGVYTLTVVGPANKAGFDTAVAAGNVTGGGVGTTISAIGGYEPADDAVVFVYTSNDAKIYTGKDAKKMTGLTITAGSAYAMTEKSSGFEYAQVALFTATAQPTITSGSKYGYLTADAYKMTENSKDYRVYTMWNGTANVTVKEESSSTLAGLTAGTVITFDTVSDGIIKNVGLPTLTTAAVTGYDGNKKIALKDTLTTVTNKEINSDTVIFYVDSDDQVGIAGGVISIADEPTAGTFTNNVKYIATTNVDFILVDVNNDMQ